MFGKILWIALVPASLAGCAGLQYVPSPSQLPWHDETFAYEAKLVGVTKDDLFRLDPALRQELKDPQVQRLSTSKRLEHLLALLYGGELKPFAYVAGHSTIAAETWRSKHGDCLSLTVLAYAMAREMNMVSQMQEVRVPVLFDRRGDVEFINDHVNVLFRGSGAMKWSGGRRQADDTVVDFEPQSGSFREGHALSDSAILARYYNNLAAEHLVNDRRSLAYAYFKAAILADPHFAPSYSNLALLYQRAGLATDVEPLLRQAITLSDEDVVPVSSLHQLLLAQGRDAEAAPYGRLLQSRRAMDPYYWIGLGLKYLQDDKIRESIQALEEAQRLTRGFDEVHRYLAVAYWRAGEQSQANEQLDLLASLKRNGLDVAALRKKFKTSRPAQD